VGWDGRRLARQKVRRDSLNADLPLVYSLVIDGTIQAPTSGTITIYEPGNSTALVDGESMTVDGNLLTYSVDTTTEDDWPIKQGYRADISAEVSGTDFTRHLIFDVAPYVFLPNIAFEHLVAMDDGIRGMAFDGEEDFSPVIEACRDELQLMIENRIRDHGRRLLEENVLDVSRMAIPFRRYVLAEIWAAKGDDEKTERHNGVFERLYEGAMATLSADTQQGGEEASEPEGVTEVLFVR